MNQYWAQSLTPGKSIKVIKDPNSLLVITNACLTQINGNQPTRVQAKSTSSDGSTQTGYIVTLTPETNEHSFIEFLVMPNEICDLEVVGPNDVDLIGYIQPAQYVEDLEDPSEEEEEED